MRRALAIALSTATASSTLLLTAAAPAQADPVSTRAYVQKCTDIGNGFLCIDITGVVGQVGVIGVAYAKNAGDVVWVKLGWQNNQGGGENWSNDPPEPVSAGDFLGTETWTTYLGEGCVFPLLAVSTGGGAPKLKGDELCVPKP